MATAIATATVAASLTTTQQAAREFWRQAGADGMPPFYVMSQYYEQLSANSDNLPAVTAALEQLLTGLGYGTDVDTVFGELAAGQAEELGYWAGRYCLFDSDGNRFDLVVGRNSATLTVPPALVDMTSLPAGADVASVTVLNNGGSFSDGTLRLANAQFQASLSFTLPISDASFDTADPAAAMFQSTAPRCSGKFGVVGGAAGTRAVNGKRGAWTQAGVNQAADGDPAAAWRSRSFGASENVDCAARDCAQCNDRNERPQHLARRRDLVGRLTGPCIDQGVLPRSLPLACGNSPSLDKRTASGRSGGNSAQTIIVATVIGTARKAPTVPHMNPQNATDTMPISGLRLSALPWIVG